MMSHSIANNVFPEWEQGCGWCDSPDEEPCAGCGDPVCQTCMVGCEECGTLVCPRCLNDTPVGSHQELYALCLDCEQRHTENPWLCLGEPEGD